MSENLTAHEESSEAASNQKLLAKVDVGKPKNDTENATEEELVRNEESLLSCTRIMLQQYGYRKSGAAVRDAVELPHNYFKPQQAVSALSNLGFKASFGSMKIEKIKAEFLPLIAFLKDGSAVIIKEKLDSDQFLLVSPAERAKNKTVDASTFKKEYSGYLILAKELNSRQKKKRGVGIGFFSSFRKK